jgi:hypothetical protein
MRVVNKGEGWPNIFWEGLAKAMDNVVHWWVAIQIHRHVPAETDHEMSVI